ncbi:MAG: amidase, partial [Rhizobiaceae bacterium]
MLDLTHGPDVGAPYHAPPVTGSFLDSAERDPGLLRIAVSEKPLMGKSVDAEVSAAFRQSVKLLEELGHEVFEAAPPVSRDQFSLDFVTVLAAELRADIEETAEAAGVKPKHGDFDPQSFGLGLFGTALNAVDYARASRRLLAAARDIGRFFETCDVLMTPTLARPPIRIGELDPTAAEKRLIGLMGTINGGWLLKRLGMVRQLADVTFEFMPWTAVFNVTGQPAMSAPLAWSRSGLPIGMQFAGRFGDEATLFSLAGQLEKARPWGGRRPDLAALEKAARR